MRYQKNTRNFEKYLHFAYLVFFKNIYLFNTKNLFPKTFI